jgi:hypothetical protein
MNPNVMGAWFNLMAEAMQGTKESQEAFQRLSKISGDPEEMKRWLTQFMPVAAASSANLQPEAFEEWMEESWRMMGVVPRPRYLELLEKCDTLQRKLDQAEETIQNLRARLDNKDQQEIDAQKMADTWGTMVQDTLKAQTEWMRSWAEANQPAAPGEDPEVTDETNGAPS